MFRFLPTLCLWTLAAAPLVGGESAAVDEDRLRGEVSRLVGELDSQRFEVRRAAAQRLDELVSKPELGRLLAGEFRRTLVRCDVSFEVQWHLTRWNRRLPAPPSELVGNASSEELDRLVRQLDDDSYAVRLGAIQRVDWLAGNPKMIYPLLTRLRHSSAEAAWQRIRGAWLLSDSACEQLPVVGDEQIGRWLDDLVRRAPSGEAADACQAQSAARRELLDLLARDEYVPRLKALLQARLDRGADGEAMIRLRELLDWTKPAMVAECWLGRRQVTQQHLLVDVPTLSPGGMKPTHFDRCDDRVAHYVAGNSLSEGDYPVGVAFPHPAQEGAFFHLVNLPTPRRRMAYAYYVKTDESKRLAAISLRTLHRFLTEKQPLSESELVMLGQLDPVEVSRFAGKCFSSFGDAPLPSVGHHRLGGRPSRFGMMCVQLALDGAKDAVPGLTDAIAKNVFLPPSSLSLYRLHWLAAFSIAARDPWIEVDVWLAEHVANRDVLNASQPGAAEVGATAAALLLSRHNRTAAQFDLQPTPDPFLTNLHVAGYRFGSDEARKKVQQWWEAEKDKKTPPPAK